MALSPAAAFKMIRARQASACAVFRRLARPSSTARSRSSTTTVAALRPMAHSLPCSTGENASQAAEQHGVQLEVIKHTEAKRGFVLLPRRWVVERSFAWAARFRRLARDYERLASTRRHIGAARTRDTSPATISNCAS